MPPRVSSLVWFLEAFARLTIYQASVLERICDAVEARRHEVVPPLVVQAVRSIAALSYAHPGVMQMGTTCLLDNSDDLPMEELEALSQALEILGGIPSTTADEATQQGVLLV